jgi:D-3-phosphoglycerate dehydrogenase
LNRAEIAALVRGTSGMAAIDVCLSQFCDHALLRLTLCTPHIGYVEQDNYEDVFRPFVPSSTSFEDTNKYRESGALQVRR